MSSVKNAGFCSATRMLQGMRYFAVFMLELTKFVFHRDYCIHSFSGLLATDPCVTPDLIMFNNNVLSVLNIMNTDFSSHN